MSFPSTLISYVVSIRQSISFWSDFCLIEPLRPSHGSLSLSLFCVKELLFSSDHSVTSRVGPTNTVVFYSWTGVGRNCKLTL